jgi:phosphoribosylaminoimidazolecarboxamide formyltransferase/IMP cyclohydrolase
MKKEVKRALLSVTDKRGIEGFAKALAERGIELIASGGTAAAVKKAGAPVTEISDLTGFPEAMDGRIKTLHPMIHGGILADRDRETHLTEAADLGIELIDLVVVNLYRFREAAAKPGAGERDVVEEIDIGGPTLIRAAAKNYHSVAVIVDPDDYDGLIEEIDERDGAVSLETRRRLASKAFHHTASYDASIGEYFESLLSPGGGDPPEETIRVYSKIRTLRYGENPHQRAALYSAAGKQGVLEDFTQLHGKELSFNNIQDLHAAFLLSKDLGKGSCAIIKHTNPCGAAACGDPAESFERARKTDPVSAFGSVVAFNGSVDARTAGLCREIFLEVIAAIEFSGDALEILAKKKNLRLITIPEKQWLRDLSGWSFREAGGLLLIQERDEGFPELENWKVVTSRKPSSKEEEALRFGWKTVKHVRSNAVLICDDKGAIGIGAGQMSRVDSCRIAVQKARDAGLDIEGASAASDAFFPFPDGVEVLAKSGVKSIVQPGGSIRDDEVVRAAEELGITMVLTGRRHFRH